LRGAGTVWQLKVEDFVIAIQDDIARNNESLTLLFQKAQERRVRLFKSAMRANEQVFFKMSFVSAARRGAMQ